MLSFFQRLEDYRVVVDSNEQPVYDDTMVGWVPHHSPVVGVATFLQLMRR